VQATPTSLNSVSWTVTFTNAVSGVAAGNFSLVNGGLGGAPAITSVAAVGGAPATSWTVTASTGSGTGTLGLNMANGTSVSATIVNLPFTGQVYTIVLVPPTVVTLAATSIGPTNATLNASVNPNGLAAAAWFQFGLTTNYGSFSATNSLAATNVAILTNAIVNSLSPGTLYHFRAVATNSAGTTNGSDLTFTTVAIPPPLLNNLAVTNGQFRFAFTNTAGQTFTVIAATTAMLPVTNWTLLGPATESPPGQFQFTDPQTTNYLERFYRVRWP